jgi:hypothetical protein
MTRHLLVHSGEKHFECAHCDDRDMYACSNKSILTKHLHLRTKSHECKHCNFRANSKSNPTGHLLLVHTGGKRFLCAHGEHHDSNKCDLTRHL